MRLSKTSWLILSVGLFVVVLAGLGLTRSQQIQAKNQVDEELSVAETRLNKLSVEDLQKQQVELQSRLDESEIELKMAKDKMRQSVESIDIIDEFFSIAMVCGVEVQGINCSSIKSDELHGIGCAVTTFSAVVEGDMSSIIGFVIKLNEDYTTGIVKSASISVAEDDPEIDNDSISRINVNMIVYSYEAE